MFLISLYNFNRDDSLWFKECELVMEKEKFYNEYVKNTTAYQMMYGDVSDDTYSREMDKMYLNGKVHISRFRYQDGRDENGQPLEASNVLNGLSLKSADQYLRGIAMSLDDNKDEQWFLIASWNSSDGKTGRRIITKLSIDSMDKDNDHIIEQQVLDTYINTYEKKLENKRYGSHNLPDMLRMPEMRSYMLAEARSFVNEKYQSDNLSDMHSVKVDRHGERHYDVEVWMAPASKKSSNNREMN